MFYRIDISSGTMILLSIIFSTIFAFSQFEEPASNIFWHWEDDFSAAEQAMVELWLNDVTSAAEATLGGYPFPMHFFIHRRKGSDEPVPWASTRRHVLQGIDFHIDPSYPLQSFLDDWTAPHEISHLSIPYLGSEHAWFAEGYASYMQYQIMQNLGICSADQVRAIYAEKIDGVKASYDQEQSFVSVARDLRDRNQYPDMYWGGASYFMKIDKRLAQDHGLILSDFIKDYLHCCRLKDESLAELMESWDRLLGEPIFSELLHIYQSGPASDIFK